MSGTQGGGNGAFEQYEIVSTPTVIAITPDHVIVEQYINPPTTENIINAVVDAGGILVGTPENIEIVNEISVYPNPVNSRGNLAFRTTKDIDITYRIIDLTGRELYRSSKKEYSRGQHKFMLPVEKLNNGIHFVQLVVDEKKLHTIRFVVAK